MVVENQRSIAARSELTDQLAAYSGDRPKDVSAIQARDEATDVPDRGGRLVTGKPSAWDVVYTPAVMKELEVYLGEASVWLPAIPIFGSESGFWPRASSSPGSNSG